MPTLQWTDSLALGLPVMDDTHHEFVDMLAQVVNAPDDTLLPPVARTCGTHRHALCPRRPLDERNRFLQHQLPHHSASAHED